MLGWARTTRDLADMACLTSRPACLTCCAPVQVNNAIYYQFMDDAVNMHLLAHGIGVSWPRFVASSSCRYLRPFAFPSDISVGLRIARLGSSSASYEIGLFPLAADGEAGELAAVGTFVHVYVDQTGRPKAFDETVRGVLSSLT